MVVALAIAGASLVLLEHLERSLIAELDEALTDQLDEASLALRRAEPLPAPDGPANVEVTILTPEGRPLYQSRTISGSMPTAARPAHPVPDRPDEPIPERSATKTVQTPEGQRVVRASASTAAVRQATGVASVSLLIGGPLLVAVVGVLTWLAAGRALRPVDAIRAEFTEISARDLHRRVPVPAARDEVGRLALTMNATLDRLESSMHRQRQFVADASHELRSPLSTVRTPLEVAAAHPDRADWLKVASEALQDLDRLETLTADLLLLARLDATAPRAPAELDLAELTREVLRHRPAGTIRWSTELADGVRVVGHRLRLSRLLTNLIDNAESHGQHTALVRVGATASDAVLEVIDDGPGIPPRDRERVFERFTRLDEARSRDTGGNGLGLPIAREIAAVHGGTLTIADTAPGAHFVARLPRAEPGDPAS